MQREAWVCFELSPMITILYIEVSTSQLKKSHSNRNKLRLSPKSNGALWAFPRSQLSPELTARVLPPSQGACLPPATTVLLSESPPKSTASWNAVTASPFPLLSAFHSERQTKPHRRVALCIFQKWPCHFFQARDSSRTLLCSGSI